jgi:hypothetical protein
MVGSPESPDGFDFFDADNDLVFLIKSDFIVIHEQYLLRRSGLCPNLGRCFYEQGYLKNPKKCAFVQSVHTNLQ